MKEHRRAFDAAKAILCGCMKVFLRGMTRRRPPDGGLISDSVRDSAAEARNPEASNVCAKDENPSKFDEPTEVTKTSNARVPTCYYIDYENVRELGLDGLLSSDEDDEFVVVYTENAHILSWEFFPFLKSRSVIPVKAPTGDQSADKRLIAQLAADVGRKGQSRRYVVVTADKGFQDVIGFLRRDYGVDVRRCESIRASLTTPTHKVETAPPRVEAPAPEANAGDRERRYLQLRETVRNKLVALETTTRLQIANCFEDSYRSNSCKPQPPDLSILLHNAFVKVMGLDKGRERYAFYKDKYGL